MKTAFQVYILFVTLLISLLSNAFATNYYVDLAGDGANDGLSWATAKKTITDGLVEADTSGDVIRVKSGVYDLVAGTLSFTTDGVTLRSDDGSGNLDPENTIIKSTAHVIDFPTNVLSSSSILEGFTIQVKNAYGIHLNLNTFGTNSPTIRGNRITTTTGGATSHGIYVDLNISTTGPIIEDNRISGPFTVGIKFVGSQPKQIKIENNYISDASSDGISIISNNVNDTFLIKNNTIISSGGNGVSFESQISPTTSPIISDNLIKSNGSNGFYFVASAAEQTTAPVFSRNSILSNTENGIYLHNFNPPNDINADLGGGGNSQGFNTFNNNGNGSTSHDLKNESTTSIKAQYNWWASNSPTQGTEYNDVDGTTDVSFARNRTLSFSLDNASGNEAGGQTVIFTADSGIYFIDKIGSSDVSTDRYRIEVKFGSNLATEVVVDASRDSLTAIVPAGTGTVDVTIINPGGQTGTLSEGYSYIVANNAPTAPVLLYPLDGTTDISIRPTFAWKNSTDSDNDKINYEFSICENPEFSDCSAISVTMIGEQILTYAGIVPFVGGGGFLLTLLILFGFRKRKNKIKLILAGMMISGLLFTACTRSNSGSDETTNDLSDENITTFTLAYDLKADTKYYWKVIAKDENGGGTSSSVLNFTTK